MPAPPRSAAPTPRTIQSGCREPRSLPNNPEPTLRSVRDLRQLTPARVGLGRTGASLPTDALLAFTLDHARARDAVHAAFDAAAVGASLRALGLETLAVRSRAVARADYLKRPDLGRRLDQASHDLLASHGSAGFDVVIVLGDGLSPNAIHRHAVELVGALLPALTAAGITLAPAVVATGARVALGDEIGALVRARLVLMLI